MATDVSSHVNGHGHQSGYANGTYDQSASSYNQQPGPAQSTSSSVADIPKDEVGWFFVEQYYTTLSRNPDKLYLFYNKRSHFVLGDETEKVPVDVGQKAINERIKKLDFQDCKVRVSNVDAQASDSNVVIQVIGEISNKSQPHRKFAQTFVLAGQTNGYFVLNDIFRYLVDEEEEEPPVEETTTATAKDTGLLEPATSATGDIGSQGLTASSDPAAVEQSAQLVDQELENKAEEVPAVINGTVASHTEESAAPEESKAETTLPEPSPAPALEPEKPLEPSPSPNKQTPQPTANAVAAPPPQPAKPAAPKTWANLAAAAHRTKAPVPQQAQNEQAAASSAPAKPAQSSAQAPMQPAAAAAATNEQPSKAVAAPEAQDDEWTSVGDHRKQQSRAQTTGAAQEPQSRAYIKNVQESVDAKQLRSLLEKFGEITYLDIARQKNCAFVDFKTPEGYKAAVAANPHQLGDDSLVVEERRIKPGAYPYAPRGGMRGGRGGAGGPGQNNAGGNRGAFQGGNRGGPGGGFNNRGRGGQGGARGGRGGAQNQQPQQQQQQQQAL